MRFKFLFILPFLLLFSCEEKQIADAPAPNVVQKHITGSYDYKINDIEVVDSNAIKIEGTELFLSCKTFRSYRLFNKGKVVTSNDQPLHLNLNGTLTDKGLVLTWDTKHEMNSSIRFFEVQYQREGKTEWEVPNKGSARRITKPIDPKAKIWSYYVEMVDTDGLDFDMSNFKFRLNILYKDGAYKKSSPVSVQIPELYHVYSTAMIYNKHGVADNHGAIAPISVPYEDSVTVNSELQKRYLLKLASKKNGALKFDTLYISQPYFKMDAGEPKTTIKYDAKFSLIYEK